MTKRKRVQDKMHQVKDWPARAPGNTIVKYRVYMYSTKKEFGDPEGTIKFKADVWITTGETSNRTRYYNSKPKLRFIPKVDVDLETGELSKTFKDHDEVVKEVFDCTNTHVVIGEIASILTGAKEDQ